MKMSAGEQARIFFAGDVSPKSGSKPLQRPKFRHLVLPEPRCTDRPSGAGNGGACSGRSRALLQRARESSVYLEHIITLAHTYPRGARPALGSMS